MRRHLALYTALILLTAVAGFLWVTLPLRYSASVVTKSIPADSQFQPAPGWTDNNQFQPDVEKTLSTSLKFETHRSRGVGCATKDFSTAVEDMDTLHKLSFRANIPLEDSKLIKKSRHFIPRTSVVNPLVTEYFLEPRDLCDGPSGAPYILFLIPSLSAHVEMRRVIRETWGSVVRQPWPGTVNLPQVRIVFVFGMSTNVNESSVLKHEHILWGDVVFADFVDSYRNLTLKSLTSLHWASTRCSGAKFVVKVDEDTFVNIPYLMEFLLYHEESVKYGIIGYAINNPVSVRSGKWRVRFTSYPLPVFPRYVYGHSYVISQDVLKDLVRVSQYIPFVPVEDAFVTGVLAHVMNFTRLHNALFATLATRPYTCAIVKNAKVTVTRVNETLHRKIWDAVESNTCTYDLLDKINLRSG